VSRPLIAPVLIPHGYCAPGCPYCPDRGQAFPIPGPLQVAEAMDRARRKAPGRPVELAFYGGDLWSLPRGPRAALLASAHGMVRRGLAQSVRVTLSPMSALRAPLGDLRARGIRAVEVPVLTFDPAVLRRLAARRRADAGGGALSRLRQAGFRTIAHLAPGLPGSSHRTAVTSAELLARTRPDAARVLPALALEGTWGATHFEAGLWVPMSIEEAVATCRHVVRRLRTGGTEIIRVGLQPAVDLQEAPDVLAGPFDPAMRQRVEAELLRAAATDALRAAFAFPLREFSFVVHPREEAYLRGHENRALQRLKEQFRLDHLAVFTSPHVPRGRPVVLRGIAGPDQIQGAVGARKAS